MMTFLKELIGLQKLPFLIEVNVLSSVTKIFRFATEIDRSGFIDNLLESDISYRTWEESCER